MGEKIFGWDLIYKASENDLKKKEDVLVLLVHVTLIKNGYRCIGLGNNKALTGTEKSSELLPSEWNSSKNYCLRYVRENVFYILRGVSVDDNMVFNFLEESSLACTNTAFKVKTLVKALRGPLETLVPTSEEVVKKIKGELIDPLLAPASKEATTQSSKNPSSAPSVFQPTRPAAPSMGFPTGRGPVNPSWTDPQRDPARVGRQDLDPFGQGGGMIFNPDNPRGGIPDPGAGIPGGLPQGSLPPGVRFDPFAPPEVGQGTRPRPPQPPDNDDEA